MATVGAPASRSSELPSTATASPRASMVITPTSVGRSAPTSVPSTRRPSASSTMIAVAPTISWALVTTIPSSRTTTPHARESPSGPVMRRRTTAGLTWSFTAATV